MKQVRGFLELILLLITYITLFVTSLNAAIVHSGIKNISISHQSMNSVSISMGGISGTFEIKDERGFFVIRRDSTSGGSYYGVSYPFIADFELHDPIMSAMDWSPILTSRGILRYDDTSAPTEFFDQGDKFIGIRALDGNDEYFGWVRVSHSMENQQFTIHDWAWNSEAGAPILAGQIPEPATFAMFAGLLALGGAACLRRRKRDFPV